MAPIRAENLTPTSVAHFFIVMLALGATLIFLIGVVPFKYEIDHDRSTQRLIFRRHQAWVIENYRTFLDVEDPEGYDAQIEY